MLEDYTYLKDSNESLQKQLEIHITNYGLLTGIYKSLGQRQTIMGEKNVYSN
jgi:hypothetical protein